MNKPVSTLIIPVDEELHLQAEGGQATKVCVPCKICADRVIGCHGMCKDYLQYAKVLGNAKQSRIEHNTYAYREKKKHERPNKMWQTHKR